MQSPDPVHDSASDAVPQAPGDSVDLYQTLAEHASVGLWHVDSNGLTRFLNPAMLALLQYDSANEVIGKHFSEFFTGEALAVVMVAHTRQSNGHAASSEISLCGRLGRKVKVLVSGTAIMDRQGTLQGMIGSFLEVTELRETERALRDNQAMLRAAVESLPFDFWTIGPDGRYTLLNNVAKANWGDLTGMRPEEVGVPPEVLAVWLENNRRALSGETIRGEVTYRADGELRHVENVLAPIRDGDEVRGLLGINIDITPRRLAEQAQRETHAMLQSVLDYSTALIFMKDAQGRYVMINRHFERSFGLIRAEVLGRTDAEIFPPEQAAAFVENDRQVLEAGRELEFEEVAQYVHGVRTSLVLKFPVRDESGKITGVGGVASDVTERRTAEVARRRADERYRVLVESARDVIFTLDRNGILESVNPACEALSGWAPSDWIGRTFLPLIVPEDQPLAEERFREVLAGHKPAPYELRAARKDGGAITVEVTLTPVEENGVVVSCLGIARDVGERRHLENQLRQAQKMESVGQLAGGVAHDFNNILTVIQGHAALIQSALDLPADVRESVEQIAEAAERAANLTRQLLTFSRRQLFRPRTVELNWVVLNMTNMLSRILGEDIALDVLPARDLPSLQCDPGMIEQVLLNLVVNARDAMPNGGHLTIRTSYCAIAKPEPEPDEDIDRTPQPCVCLTVSDTGCGIDPACLPRIFEPFFTTKGIGRGTGLGLATVYGIVHQHRGWITVDSTVSKGTTFCVHLPSEGRAESTASDETVPVPDPKRGTERILIVEDEVPVRTLVSNVLTRLGYQVLTASSGVEALRLWSEVGKAVDLVLTDIVMPGGINGRDLAETLLSDRPDLPIIYTSGYAPEAVRGTVLFRDGENFLQKPYPPGMLADLIRRTLDARK